jgi:hypothetical protein
MTMRTVTAKGQVTFRKDVLQQLGVDPGQKIADGVIAHQGRRLGAQTFVSFDKQAVALFEAKGEPAMCLV